MIFRAAKLCLYKTIVRLVVMYASELWEMTKQAEDNWENWETDATRNFGKKKMEIADRDAAQIQKYRGFLEDQL